MEAQTYSVFQALGGRGAREGLDLLLALIENAGTVEQLVERAAVASGTASRRLEALSLAGVVSRPRPRDPYELTCPEETRRFVEAASSLAVATMKARGQSEEALRKRVGKSRLTASETDESSSVA